MDILTAFLRRRAGRPSAPGKCALFSADWILERTGIDPADGARALPEREWASGEMLRFVARQMRRAGFRMTRNPKGGDVAMVLIGNQVCACIWTGRRWAAQIDSGLVLTTQGRRIMAWSV